jgi:hypothetical protein
MTRYDWPLTAATIWTALLAVALLYIVFAK